MSSTQTDSVAFLLDTVMGCWKGPTLWISVNLQLPDKLEKSPATAQTLASQLQVDAGYLQRILNALSSIGVFERLDDGRYGPTAVSAMMCEDHPSGFAQLIDTALGGQNYLAWSSFEESVRTGTCAFNLQHGVNWIDYLDEHPQRRDIFAKAMTATTRATEDAVIGGHDFGAFNKVVDIGGSNGSLVGALLNKYSTAQGIVFDLPDTVNAGKKVWQGAAYANRLEAVGGDFFKSVPEADLYLLKLILHDWQDDDTVAILKTIRHSIAPQGRVAIIETVLPNDSSPHTGWGLDIAMMVTTGGRERSLLDHSDLLQQAGFEVVSCTPTPSMYSVIEARPV